MDIQISTFLSLKVYCSRLLTTFQLEQYLKPEYDILSIDCAHLPSNQASPVHPFLGFVVNLNIASRCHRDWGDNKFCIVLAIGDFEGGELCLMEAGLVIPMRNGDFTLFLSGDVTHFNLHFKGERASFVLHSDKEIRKWNDDRNGWNHNITLS